MAAISSAPRPTLRRSPRAIRAILPRSCFRRARTSGGRRRSIRRSSNWRASTRCWVSRCAAPSRERSSGARRRWAIARGSWKRTGIRSAPPRRPRRCATSTAACSPPTPRARTAIWGSASTTTGSRAPARWLGFLPASSVWAVGTRSGGSATCGAWRTTATSRASRAHGCSRRRCCARPRAIRAAAPF